MQTIKGTVKTVPQRINGRIKPTVASFGEIITVTTSVATAYNALQLFRSLTSNNEKRVIFVFTNNDNTTFVNNQCISFEIQMTDGKVMAEPYLWTRQRDGNLSSSRSCNSEYDLIINAGDVFKKVVLL